MSFQMDKTKMNIMPVVFGSMPESTRQLIHPDPKTGKIEAEQMFQATNHITIYESNPEELEKILPEKVVLDKPYVIVTHRMNRNFAGLGGNGYNLVQVTIPVRFEGEKDQVKGMFMPVIWEGHSDCCMLGRDLLGYCKIFATVSDVTGHTPQRVATASSWGHQFLDLTYDFSEELDAASVAEMQSILNDPENGGEINYVYLNRVGSRTETDRDYFTILPKAKELVYPDNVGDVPAPTAVYGTGDVVWHPATFAQCPTQCHIVNGLEQLGVKRVVGTYKTMYYHLGNYATVRIIE